ncbi:MULTISPECIES: hypothetical protein [Anaerotruncus]|uniref:hypothetical protein n=3 Tax=Oscillospiraceae TaxID=216572 RepID=UPI0008341979|nr:MULTISPECIES: hypothetical protein [Anaerotruncus]RGX56271.1 hypothetical protein DWV16_04195 [Anaerotruncus sp. AF02-27]
MRKVLLICLSILLLSTSASGRIAAAEPVLMPGMSCLALYEDFSSRLASGQIIRTEIGFDSLYDFVSYTQEEISFHNNDNGKLELTYRSRQPFVFWHYPQADYYDGNNYYYSYNGDWFIDLHNRFTEHLRQDFMGIPTFILEDYPIVRDEVFYQDFSFFGYLTTQAPGSNRRYTLTAKISLDGDFESIGITISELDQNGETHYQHYYRIVYSDVNAELKITPPPDLDKAGLELLKENLEKGKGPDAAHPVQSV